MVGFCDNLALVEVFELEKPKIPRVRKGKKVIVSPLICERISDKKVERISVEVDGQNDPCLVTEVERILQQRGVYQVFVYSTIRISFRINMNGCRASALRQIVGKMSMDPRWQHSLRLKLRQDFVDLAKKIFI